MLVMGLLLNPEFVTLFSWQWFNGSVISRVIYVEIDFFLLLSLSLFISKVVHYVAVIGSDGYGE